MGSVPPAWSAGRWRRHMASNSPDETLDAGPTSAASLKELSHDRTRSVVGLLLPMPGSAIASWRPGLDDT
jgi:hypothetical protein